MRGQSTPLSNKEKAHLSRLAQDAWSQLARAGATDQREHEWRREQALSAAGVRISEATRRHFASLKAHFLAMAGKAGEAFQTAVNDDPRENPRRQALWQLRAELAKNQLDASYAEEILRDKYRATFATATDKQVWTIVYDIRRNRRRRPRAH